MSKRFIPVLLLLILGGLFVTYGVMGKTDKLPDEPAEKYQRIIRNVGIVLEQGHYGPKKIDDKFSDEVLKSFIKALDPDKVIFLNSDIKSFQKYANQIDDEIHGAPLKSFFDISDVYLTRFDELEALNKKALAQPINFDVKEYQETDADKRDFPENEEQRFDIVRKLMKYQVLIRYAGMVEERDTSSAMKGKTDADLIKESAGKVNKIVARSFGTSRNHNTVDNLFSIFVNSITSIMDPHTTYFNPDDKRSFDEALSGTFYGIGAQLQEIDGQIKIASLVLGTPAWKSGELAPEDIILKVGQGSQPPVDVTSYSLEDAVKLIRGEKGTEVRLTIKKQDGSAKVISLIRDKIDLFDTYAKSAVIEGDHNRIGYIRLPEFYADFNDPGNGRRSATDVAIEVKKLMDAGVDGIVIDLRMNGGGSLQDVIDMVGLFVKSGPVVQVKGRVGKATIEDSPEKEPLYTGPLAVMVDEQSASASEIFAAAIQDYKRGVIIGNNTFGKGTVQRNVSLNPQSESVFFSNRSSQQLGFVKLTFKKFYRIDGGTTQLRGVTPDIRVPDRWQNLKIREKDNPYALGWDTIRRANYVLWDPGYSYENIVREASEQIRENYNFKGINEVVNKIDSFQNKLMPLRLKEYNEMQAVARGLAKELEKYSSAVKPLNVQPLKVDLDEIREDSIRVKSRQQFVTGVSKDIYVGETVSVMSQLIGKRDVAMREGKLRDPQE